RDGALWYLRQFNSSYQPNTGAIHRVLGPDGAPAAPGVSGDRDTAIGAQDTVSVHWAVHNTGACAGAQVFRIRDPQALLVPPTTPLAGIPPRPGPGDSFGPNLQVASPAVCDPLVPDTLTFAAHPLDFPASVAVETTLVHCSATETAGVASFTLLVQGPSVRL